MRGADWNRGIPLTPATPASGDLGHLLRPPYPSGGRCGTFPPEGGLTSAFPEFALRTPKVLTLWVSTPSLRHFAPKPLNTVHMERPNIDRSSQGDMCFT